MMRRLHCNVFMLSYRGYGASDGYPSQHGITKDAQAALDHLCNRSDIDTSRIVIFGRSLGGAVGSVLARNNPDKVSALILENTFTSILDMAGIMLPFLKWFMGGRESKGPKVLNFLVWSPWSTIDVIGENKNNWKKTGTHFVLDAYLQPLPFWTGAILACRTMDSIVLPSKACEAVKQRLMTSNSFDDAKKCESTWSKES